MLNGFLSSSSFYFYISYYPHILYIAFVTKKIILIIF